MKKKWINKIFGGLFWGIVLSGIWVIIFLIAIRDAYAYGMAILPAILISILLFIIGGVVGVIIAK